MSLKLTPPVAPAALILAGLSFSVGAPDTVRADADLRIVTGSVGAAAHVPAIGVEAPRSERALAQDATVGSRGWSDFLQSTVIILREGLEAILILGALLAFLVKSGNREHRPSVYWGAGLAVVLSLATAVVVELAFGMAEASQELLEGVTMLVAAAVLFSISYWLVSKVEHKRWERYIRDKLSIALSRESRLALGVVAFLAVYREGFETVLFYQALAGSAESTVAVFAGFGSGVAALALIGLLIYRFGVRIPLRPFFAGTSAVLYYMAFVFAGRGIHEIQEAGVMPESYVAAMPRIELLGIYPTVQGLAVQAVLLAALVGALLWTFVVVPARKEVAEAPVEATRT